MVKTGLLGVTVAVTAALVQSSTAAAQSAVMPLPVAVAKDGDGKVFGGISDCNPPTVMVEIDGVVNPFEIRADGPKALPFNQDEIMFQGENCSGDPYMVSVDASWYLQMTGVRLVVMGPDDIDGTYRVFRSTGSVQTIRTFESEYHQGSNTCEDVDAKQQVSVPAEEIVPSPLEGFHGPSLVHPDLRWTIDGGTKLIPPSP